MITKILCEHQWYYSLLSCIFVGAEPLPTIQFYFLPFRQFNSTVGLKLSELTSSTNKQNSDNATHNLFVKVTFTTAFQYVTFKHSKLINSVVNRWRCYIFRNCALLFKKKTKTTDLHLVQQGMLILKFLVFMEYSWQYISIHIIY